MPSDRGWEMPLAKESKRLPAKGLERRPALQPGTPWAMASGKRPVPLETPGVRLADRWRTSFDMGPMLSTAPGRGCPAATVLGEPTASLHLEATASLAPRVALEATARAILEVQGPPGARDILEAQMAALETTLREAPGAKEALSPRGPTLRGLWSSLGTAQ